MSTEAHALKLRTSDHQVTTPQEQTDQSRSPGVLRFERQAALRARLARTSALVRRLAGPSAGNGESLRRELCRQYGEEIGQSLSSVLAELHRRLDRHPDPHEWVDAMETLRETVGLACTIPDVGHPPELRDLGLADSLRVLGARFERLTGACVNVEVVDAVPPLSPSKALALHSLVRNALADALERRGVAEVSVVAHASVAAVQVRVVEVDDTAITDPSASYERPTCSDRREDDWTVIEAIEEILRLGGAAGCECSVRGTVALVVRLPVGDGVVKDLDTEMGPAGGGPSSPPSPRRTGARRQTSAAREHCRTRNRGTWFIPWRPDEVVGGTSTLGRIERASAASPDAVAGLEGRDGAPAAGRPRAGRER